MTAPGRTDTNNGHESPPPSASSAEVIRPRNRRKNNDAENVAHVENADPDQSSQQLPPLPPPAPKTVLSQIKIKKKSKSKSSKPVSSGRTTVSGTPAATQATTDGDSLAGVDADVSDLVPGPSQLAAERAAEAEENPFGEPFSINSKFSHPFHPTYVVHIAHN